MILEVVLRGLPVERLKKRSHHRRYAHQTGRFWLPCPLCGQEFGGHEWDRLKDSSIPTSDPMICRGICPACTLAGFGKIITEGLVTADHVRARIVIR